MNSEETERKNASCVGALTVLEKVLIVICFFLFLGIVTAYSLHAIKNKGTGTSGKNNTAKQSRLVEIPSTMSGDESFLTCGRSPISKKEAKSDKTLQGKWPWIVYFMNAKKFIGSGTLINDQWILTAAHVLKKYEQENIMAVLGAHRLYSKSDGRRRKIKKIVIHPKFDRDTHDLALLKMKRPITFRLGKKSSILSVCLPKPEEELEPGGKAYVIGWGRTEKGESYSSLLKEALVTVLPFEKCQNLSGGGGNKFSQKNNFCIMHEKDWNPTCQDNSGDPLLINNGGLWFLHGVIAFTPPNCEHSPTVYTKVSAYMKWIDSVLKNNE